MFDKIKTPKSDLHFQATERRTVFPQLALRQRSTDHPMVMFSAIVAAAFVWTLVPSDSTPAHAAASRPPVKIVSDTQTTGKTSRLPISDVDRACAGQSWGGESVDCLSQIARQNGKADLKVRLIADAAPADLDTPNIF
jgi:hypothetical protein